MIRDAGIDALCTDHEHADHWQGFTPLSSPVPNTVLLQTTQPAAMDVFPAGTAKVTFTSGTTGRPRGVCLDAAAMVSVAESIVTATADLGIERHLCLLPLALLLENITGVYAPLLAGACIILPSGRERGLQGSQQLDIGQLFNCLHRWQAKSLVLVPRMLNAMTVAVSRGMPLPDSLRFVAVGGARVSPELLDEARTAGIPVSPTSLLTLQKALNMGLLHSMDAFYSSARAILVKSERYFDLYDQVFAHHFQGAELPDQPAAADAPGAARTEAMPAGVVEHALDVPVRAAFHMAAQRRAVAVDRHPHRPAHVLLQRLAYLMRSGAPDSLDRLAPEGGHPCETWTDPEPRDGAVEIPVGLMPGADPAALPAREELEALAADGLAPSFLARL